MELSNTPRAATTGGGLDDQVYQRLLKERIIFLGSVVEDSMANAICAQMLLLAAEDPEKDIYLYINSPGGSISAGMAIYDTMQYIEAESTPFRSLKSVVWSSKPSFTSSLGLPFV